MVKLKKAQYMESKISMNSYNQKLMWKCLKDTVSMTTNTTKIKKVVLNGVWIEDENEIANELNKYFVESIMSIHNSIENIVMNEEREVLDRNIFEFRRVTTDDIIKTVSSLKNKYGGKKMLTEGVIKDSMEYLGYTYVCLINESFSQGIFPERWKISVVIPVEKIRGTTKPEELRPINTLQCDEKIIETIAKDQLLQYLDDHQIIIQEQSGFRSKHSCESAINLRTGYPFGESCSNDCYIYQTTGKKPSVKRIEATGDAPIPQYGPGIVLHEHYLYTVGGTTGYDYSCDVHRLNLRTRVWECVYICRPDIREDPEGRYRHEVVYDGQYIYVLGGGTSNLVYDLQRIPAFNLITNRWEYFVTLPDRTSQTNLKIERQNSGYPNPRKCFSCVQHTKSNGEVEAFITGGLQADQVYFSDIWRLNFTTKQWTLIKTASLPKALYFHAAAHSQNGCMYIFGGIEYDEKRIRRCNDLYKMWMTIPLLSEICWEAVLHYRPNLKLNGHSQLLKMGIPLRFAQRLWHSSKVK
ncbi:kelch domain-containing protein 10 homolog [Anastrepha obliqua]|uniref:kelch domain-containing protein 10 homolog n=1 Tax=Anastrepha obliqua TaxID=95512 RepID=UPI00240A3081|nr:kelch domain-containing protein 10 homolog [Anastrepha obliqua]